MRLFICEKPSQAKEISAHAGAGQRQDGYFSGNGVMVTWCIGHLLEQAPPDHYVPALKSWNLSLLPVLPTEWQMLVKPKVKPQYLVVAKLVKQASEVIIATDADREGECIAREVMQLTGYRGPVSRLWLSALDDVSVKKGLAKLLPGEKTLPMYFSGLGRSRADWLTGMNITMALTKAFGPGGKDGVLHCGRVQTPVLALIVRRERSIQGFKPKTYFELDVVFDIGGQPVPMAWVAPTDILDKQGHCIEGQKIESIAKTIDKQSGAVVAVETKPERELCPLPYSLGSLQRDASAKYGMKAQAVLDACQALYEKHKATSYPRTDCEYLPLSMFGEASAVLNAVQHADPLIAPLVSLAKVDQAVRCFNDKKISAHHAIIPTLKPNVDIASMQGDEVTVYNLIRRRYIAQFLGDFAYDKTTIQVECRTQRFRASGKTPTSLGWKLAYPTIAETTKAKSLKPAETEGTEDQELQLPACKAGDPALNIKAAVKTNQTKPPKRYTEGTLLGAMESIDKEIEDPRLKKIMQNKEKAGIGTDATRSSVIENLFGRNYIGNERKFIVPSPKGIALIELIERIAPELADPVLTAVWEDQLGQIEAGALRLEQFEGDLGSWLQKLIEKIKSQAANPLSVNPRQSTTAPAHKQADETIGSVQEPLYPCPLCRKSMKQRSGPSGAFWGCTSYPNCKHTQPDDGGKPGTRSGDIAGKSTFTETHRSVKVPTTKGVLGQKCPTCEKGVLVKKVLQDTGAAFVGCNHFPACRHFQWA